MMGWNTGYTIFEATVIGAYDLGVLDIPLLSVLMEPYRETDIDSGGSRGLQSKDGKGVEQIVIETFGGKYPKRPILPEDYTTWTEKQWDSDNRFCDRADKAFRKITKNFGWGD